MTELRLLPEVVAAGSMEVSQVATEDIIKESILVSPRTNVVFASDLEEGLSAYSAHQVILRLLTI